MASEGFGSGNNNGRPSNRATNHRHEEDFVRRITGFTYTVDSLVALNPTQRRNVLDNLNLAEGDRRRCNIIVARGLNRLAARRSRSRRDANIADLERRLEEERQRRFLEEFEFHLNMTELRDLQGNMTRLLEDVSAGFEAANPTRRFVRIDVLDNGDVVIIYEPRNSHES